MRIVALIIGSGLLVFFVVLCFMGRKYNDMLEGLEGGEFPLKGLYPVGFALNDIPPFRLRGKMRENLIENAKLLNGNKYAEYYATVAWAQSLTFAFLGVTAGVLLWGATGSALMLVIGVAVGGVFGFFFVNRMKDLLSTRSAECTAELPEVVSTMALLVGAGMVLREAWRTIAYGSEGTIYSLMRDSCEEMEGGGVPEVEAIHRFGRLTNSQEVVKFTSALAQSIERGGGELNNFLDRQSTEIWTLKKQLMLQKGETASSKLLLPTALLFVGIIIAVVCGAIGMLF